MVTTGEIITFLNSYNNPTTSFFFDINMDGLQRIIKPETNLYSLIMLSKAREQGLDLVFVDKEKFFDNAMLGIRGDLLNGQGPFEGAWYIEFQLSPVLLHGQSFDFIDHSESMGFGFMLDTMNFGNEIVNHFLQNTGKLNNGEWYRENVGTIQQLTDYINKVLAQPDVVPKQPSKLPRWSDVKMFTIILGIGICVGLYYVLKLVNRLVFKPVHRFIITPIYKVYSSVDKFLNTPIESLRS